MLRGFKSNKGNSSSDTMIALLCTVGVLLIIGYIGVALEPKCSKSGCDNKAAEGSSYCYIHKPYRYTSHSTSRDYNSTDSNSTTTATTERSDSTRVTTNQPSTTRSSYSTQSSTSSYTGEMPDCDDYEDYDEFMDDWDGCMPDGSDAEDYWEDW